MYSLDINFLNDRTQRPTEAGLAAGPRRTKDDPRPLYVGAAIGVALPLLMLGFWVVSQNQNRSLQQRQAELDSQLTALQAQLSEVNSINEQISQIDSENKALATVFDRIKPWSAVLQDVRDRVPNGVQIRTVEQFQPEAAAAPAPSPVASPSPAASPSPGASPEASPAPAPAAEVAITPSGIRITGTARSFNDVNDFLLTLQRSPFLSSEDLKLVRSQLIDNPTEVEFTGQSQNLEVKLPQVVEYTIEGNLTNLTASELLQDLERTLSVGLAARIQALRDRGVLKP